MNALDRLDVVLVEIHRFERTAHGVAGDSKARSDFAHGIPNRKVAAMRRASLDLSAALSAMRQHGKTR